VGMAKYRTNDEENVEAFASLQISAVRRERAGSAGPHR